jgi:predicted acetyltransferase
MFFPVNLLMQYRRNGYLHELMLHLLHGIQSKPEVSTYQRLGTCTASG